MSSVVPDPAAIPPQTARVVNIANGLTVARLLLVPVFAVALLHESGENTAWRVAACVIFAVASVTDRIDGDLARRRGLVTEFGKLADPIADKALTGTALVGLSALGLLPWWVTVVILVREVGVTLLRFWVIRHGVIPASRGGKAKTLVQSVAIGLYLLPLSGPLATLAMWAMGAAIVLTVVTGIDYVARALTLRRTSLRAAGQHGGIRPGPGAVPPSVVPPGAVPPSPVQPGAMSPSPMSAGIVPPGAASPTVRPLSPGAAPETAPGEKPGDRRLAQP